MVRQMARCSSDKSIETIGFMIKLLIFFGFSTLPKNNLQSHREERQPKKKEKKEVQKAADKASDTSLVEVKRIKMESVICIIVVSFFPREIPLLVLLLSWNNNSITI